MRGGQEDYATKSMLHMRSLFRNTLEISRAKLELSQHLTTLVLTPKQGEQGPFYEVTGDWNLLPDERCVILMVARDGIEPPTPAFSGPRSTS